VVLELPIAEGDDLRDVLETGVTEANGRRPDVLVTIDAAVIAYAERRGEHVSVALPWSATYALVPAMSTAGPPPSREQRDALARDAVTSDARGAEEPFAWLADTACAEPLTAPGRAAVPVVVYPTGDPIARQLAERVVALAGVAAPASWLASLTATGDARGTPRAPGASRAPPLRVSPVPSDSVRAMLASGRVIAAVMPIARDPRTRCGTRDGRRAPRGALPLVDSRAHALVRRGSGAAFVIASDGSLTFVRQGAR
jgi:hypothetical protein